MKSEDLKIKSNATNWILKKIVEKVLTAIKLEGGGGLGINGTATKKITLIFFASSLSYIFFPN